MIADARPARAGRASALHLGLLLPAAAAAGLLAVRSPGIALGVAFVAAAGAAVLARPELATLGVVALVWLNVPALAVDWWGVPQVAGAAFPLLLLLPLIHDRMRGEPAIVDRVFVALILLLAAMLVSSILAAHQPEALEKLRQFVIEGVLLYLLVVNVVRTPGTLRGAIWAMLLAGAFLALVTIYQQLRHDYYRTFLGFAQVDSSYYRLEDQVARLTGPLGDPNYYAQILLPLIPLGVLTARRERRQSLRLLAIASTMAVLLAIAFTYSRGAAIALVVVLVAMMLLGHVRGRHVLAAAAAVALLLALVPAYRERVETIGSSVGGATAKAGEQTTADQSTRSRTTEMGAAGLAFLHHPLFGVGPEGFPFYYQEYAQRVGIEVHERAARTGETAGQLPQREAHNLFIGVAADLGLAGLSAFLAILYLAFRNLLRARRRWRWLRVDLVLIADSLFLALLAYVVAGLFLSLAFERYFWLLIGLAGAAGGVALGSGAVARTERR